MKVQNSITFIVSKNYGRPLSFSLPVWRVYFGAAICLVLGLGMILLSVMYLFSNGRFRQMEQEFHQLIKERDSLREQILSVHGELFQAKEALYFARSGPGSAPARDSDGESAGSAPNELYEPPLRVDSYTTRVNRKTVEISFRLVNQGDAKRNRGGFLFAIFENEDLTPIQFIPTPSVNTNEEGFPQTYKSGIHFTRIKQAVTFRRRVKRPSLQDYFTHVTLFLFSVRGGLILKERYELDKDLFFKDKPVVKIQKTSNI